MLKRIAIIALLGTLGFAVGYTSTWLGGHRYSIGTVLWLPRHSAPSPAELVAMTSGRHPGAQVRASGGNMISIEATALGITGGIALASVLVILAAFLFALYSRQYDVITPGL